MERNAEEITKVEGKELWHVNVPFGVNDDNKKYLMSGIAVAVSVYALCGGRAFGVLLGIVTAILIAFGKECYDHCRKRLAWDWADVVWMLIGGFVGGVVSAISHALWT